MLSSEVRVFREARSIIAESIWWDDDGLVRWCDIDTGELHGSPLDGSTDGRDDEYLSLGPPVACFQPAGDGFIVAGLEDVFRIDRDGSNRRAVASISRSSDALRFNEGKCDPFGNFVVGTMDVAGGTGDAAIYSISPAGDVTTLVDGLGVTNGFEWSDDGSRMWFSDTAASAIYVGDYDGRSLANIRTFFDGRASDGFTRDRDGGFWNGINDTGRVIHLTPNGEVDLEFDVPAGHVTSVGFGGRDLATLFIGTAREKLTEAELEQQPLTGSIFAVDTITAGYPARRFGSTTERHH